LQQHQKYISADSNEVSD